MENLTRALTIAGGIVIAVMVVSLFIFGFSRITKYQNRQEAEKHQEQIAEFNEKFYAYNQKVVTGYKMVSLGHLTMDVNDRKEKQEEGFEDIEVYLAVTVVDGTQQGLPGSYGINKAQTINGKKYYNLIEYLSECFDDLPEADEERNKFKKMYFECTDVELDKDTSRVWRMFFKEIKEKN